MERVTEKHKKKAKEILALLKGMNFSNAETVIYEAKELIKKGSKLS